MSELSTCWTAVQAAAAGDAAERTRFAVRYTPVIRAYFAARWRGAAGAADADDAVQEVFLECFKDGGVLEAADPGRPRGFRAFLLGVMRNVAARLEKRRSRRREVALPESTNPPPALAGPDDPDLAFDRAWAEALVAEAVATQRERAARQGGDAVLRVEILDLRFKSGLPIRDIAKKQGRDAAEVHRDYARARRDFHLCLREVVAFHLPDSTAGIEVECRRLLDLMA